MGKPLDWIIWSTKTHSYTGKNDYKQTVLSYYMKSYRPRKKYCTSSLSIYVYDYFNNGLYKHRQFSERLIDGWLDDINCLF